LLSIVLGSIWLKITKSLKGNKGNGVHPEEVSLIEGKCSKCGMTGKTTENRYSRYKRQSTLKLKL
jgi:hypothetical protein